MEPVRVDKWLWAARFFKTRSAATEAVAGGRVHVNGSSVKPSKEIRTGDMIQLTIRSGKRTVMVVDLSERRGPSATAAALYTETPESIRARESAALERRLYGQARGTSVRRVRDVGAGCLHEPISRREARIALDELEPAVARIPFELDVADAP